MTIASRLFIGLIALLSFACSSSKKTVEHQPPTVQKPEWVLQRPISSTHYIGIGMALKKYCPAEYPNVAKKNAISDLASEIKVSVSGNSVLKQYEDNDQFRETFSNNTKVQVKEDLEEFEQVGAWESNEEFWIYYRLSKSKYREIKQRKIDAAIDEAKLHMAIAEEMKKSFQNGAAFQNYFKAFLSIERYLDEDLRTQLDGKEVYFASELLNRLESSLSELEVEAVYPSTGKFECPWGTNVGPEILKFKVTANGKAIKGLKMEFFTSRARTQPQSATSNENGYFSTSLDVKKGLPRREVLAQLKLDDNGDKILKAYISKLNLPSARFYIDVRDPSIKINSTERSLGNDNGSSLSSVFSASLTKEGFVSRAGSADYICSITTDTKASGESNGFFTSYLNGELLIKRAGTEELIFSYSLNNIKGVGLNYESASQKAYEATATELERKAAWQFIEQMR